MVSNLPPGGLIISGIGGCLAVGTFNQSGLDLSGDRYTENYFQTNQQNNNDPFQPYGHHLDVTMWRLQIIRILKTCPHSGALGAISRRPAGYDFRYSLATPYDYTSPPDYLLGAQGGWQPCAVRFNLADVVQEPMIQNPVFADLNVQQRCYIAPAAHMERALPVLNAAGNVIRMQIEGCGTGHLFLLPDQSAAYQAYLLYMRTQNWQT